MNEYNPQSLPHPCETILEKIEEMNISIAEFISKTGLSEETMMPIINGHGSITLDVAKSLERTTKIPFYFWLTLQRNYDDCKIHNTQKELVMDKLKRYDMNVECDSRSQSSEYHWVEEEQNHDGEWVRYSEVRDEIERLESEKVELLKALNAAREYVQWYAEAKFPDGIELDKQIEIIITKSKGQQ
jgi:addiction module HigA family antidote